MQRPLSRAPPSHAPIGRFATKSTRTSSTSVSHGRWRTRGWLLVYVVLGLYVAAMLCSFWTPPWSGAPLVLNLREMKEAEAPAQPLHLFHQNVPLAGSVNMAPIAENVNELEGGTGTSNELVQEQDESFGKVLTKRETEKDVGAPLNSLEEALDSRGMTDLSTSATPSALAPTAPFVSSNSVGIQVYEKFNAWSIPPRQNDAILLSYKKEETDNEAWKVEDVVGNEATETSKISLPIDESRLPVQRSQEFTDALNLVYSLELSAASSGTGSKKAALVTGLRDGASDRDLWKIGNYEHQISRLEGINQEANEESERLKELISATDELILEERYSLEDVRAASTVDLRFHESRRIRNNLKCIGWRQTGQCSSFGKREPSSDSGCKQLVHAGVSGYCEVMDEETGESFRVMQLNCSSLLDRVVFSCADATDFANFGLKAQNVYENALAQNTSDPSKLLGNSGTGDGIVIVVYPKLVASVFALVSVLRSYNCTLPIELWILQSEVTRTPSTGAALKVLQQQFLDVSVETIIDPTIFKFCTKIYAIQHSKFENVLFLDADSVPVRDPTFLFRSQEYRKHGAIFWPDFWHPDNTMFGIHRESLLWELVDLPFVDMFEQESGQMLINRKRAAPALEVLMFFASHLPNYFNRLLLAHGDKDLFRLAWMKAHASFFMMPFPPALAGPTWGTNSKLFCGMTMVQFDVDGDVLFLHRNAKELGSTVDHHDSPFWTHLQMFKWERPLAEDDDEDTVTTSKRTAVQRLRSYEDLKQMYRIAIVGTDKPFRGLDACYGTTHNLKENFKLTKFEDLPFANLEQEITSYAHEAQLLMEQA
uniref:Alpha-1,3-mannosyltransferase n=1 Tax=Peronospora matthiolae TaxID=2874970 RepID=A0AAV1T1C7_9STRA